MKIAIIGGGSAYAPGLVQAFAADAASFAGCELALMDVAGPELEIVQRLATRLLEKSDLRVSATTDRVRAIEGADVVLTTFRQGGLAARHLDESVPLAFGVIGQETIGPGGFFFAMRTLSVIRAIAGEVAAHAPDALVVNYTNPTQIVAEALTRFTTVRSVAICDQTDDDRVHLAAALGLEPHAIELVSRGVNHATWSSTCRIAGEDGGERIAAAADDLAARADVAPRVRRQAALTRAFGSVPNGYLPYYYYRDESVAEARAAQRTRAQTIAAELPAMYRHFAEQALAERPRLSGGRGGSVFGDFAVRVIRAFTSGGTATLTLNVANGGALPDLDPERIVEVPCRIEGGVATPLPQPRFASDTVGLIRMLADYQAAAAEAIWAGDPEALERALAANPLVVSLTQARALLRARAEAARAEA